MNSTVPVANLDLALKALANPLRRQILDWLRDPETHFPQQEHAFLLGVCAGQIERKCALAQSTVSGHLGTLQRAGLITCQKLGQIHFFKRCEETIAQLAQALEVRL